MSEIITVGLDLAKNVFEAHGADASGRAVLRKKLRRDQVLAFFGQMPPCVVAMEACGGAHFWGREIGKLGHQVRLIPPAYVKPFVKRQKNDAADAEAICEAAQRPTMRFVPVKSEDRRPRPRRSGKKIVSALPSRCDRTKGRSTGQARRARSLASRGNQIETMRLCVCAVSDPLKSSVPAGRVNGDFPSEVSEGGRDGGWRRRFWWPDRCDFADTGLSALAG